MCMRLCAGSSLANKLYGRTVRLLSTKNLTKSHKLTETSSISMLRKTLAYVPQGSTRWFQTKSPTMTPLTNRNENNYIVWMDLEMTGLDVDKDTILEASCILTDEQLSIVAEAPTVVINQPDTILNNMNNWCKVHHQKSGLTEASRNSKITMEKAEILLLNFLKDHIPSKTCPLAGNTIYMDRIFISKYMPKLNDYMHYRIIDVSSTKELCKRWNQKIYSQAPAKKLTHRSYEDIRESIEELKYYKKFMFLSDKQEGGAL